MKLDPSLLFLLVMVVLFVLVLRRGSRARSEAAAVQSGLAPGAQIMTTSGLYATVVSLDAESVTLETAPGQRSRWDRRAVARVITKPADDVQEQNAAGGPYSTSAIPPSGVVDDEPGPQPPGSSTRSTTDSDETTPPGTA